MSTRIVFCGLPGCGKSTLAVSLSMVLERMGITHGLHQLDIYSRTHEYLRGECSWDERERTKRNSIAPDPEFALLTQVNGAFQNDTRPLVVGDASGRLFGRMPLMIRGADAAFLLARDPEGFADWDAFLRTQNIPVAIRGLSYIGARPTIPRGVDFLFGNLDRTLQPENPDIIRLAEHLADTYVRHADPVAAE